jgi:hypothetical protein
VRGYTLAGRTLVLVLAALVVASCTGVPGKPPAPPPPPAPLAPVPVPVVDPADGYTDELGYVRLEYRAADARSTTDPAPARIVVHIGRRALLDANTAWYTVVVSEEAKELLRVAGEEGIPNVKGPDGNWWSEIPLDLPRPPARQTEVRVDDTRSGRSYLFTIRIRHAVENH